LETLDELISQLRSRELTPGEVMAKVIERFLKEEIPDENREEQKKFAASIAADVVQALRTLNYAVLPELQVRLWGLLPKLRMATAHKTWSARGVVERVMSVLGEHGWNGVEIQHLLGMLQQDETIQRIEFWQIVTSSRTISRAAVQAWGRPASWTSDQGWARQFDNGEVARLEAQEAERERQSARNPWADNRNTDLR
jgi:hypothetical protein